MRYLSQIGSQKHLGRRRMVLTTFICFLQLCSYSGDEELVQELLFDAVVTAPMEAYWTALALNMSE